METQYPIIVRKELSLLATLIVLFFSESCFSQLENKIFRTTNLNGNEVNLISEETLIENSIFSVSLSEILSSQKDIDSIKEIFGNPLHEYTEQDKAMDGTILFETKFIIYDGVKMIFSKKREAYELSRIKLTNSRSCLNFEGNKISIGENLELQRFKNQGISFTYNFRIANSDLYMKKSISEISESLVNNEFIRISVDTEKNKINSISILMYSI